MKTAFIVAFTLSVALAGCGSATESADEPDATASSPTPVTTASASTDEPSQVQTEPMVALDGEGLRIVMPSGSTRLLAFGSERAEIERIMGQISGVAPSRSENGECGAGPMQMTAYGNLTLNFQSGTFVGWYADGEGGWATMDGIGTGSTRKGVEATRTTSLVEGSTLGTEFATGDGGEGTIGGFFEDDSADAMVTGLYAGTNCFFR